jgi:multiple sugar transport system permease protein
MGAFKWKALYWVILSVAFLPLVCSALLVLGTNIFLSLHDYTARTIATGAPFVGIANYSYALTDSRFLNALKVSFLFLVLCVVGETIVGVSLSYVFAKPLPRIISKGKVLIILPLAISPAAASLIWRWFFSTQYGIINFLLALIGIQGPDWTARPTSALFAMVFVDLWQWVSFTFAVLLAAMQGIPAEVYEAASIDGASEWTKFWKITIPFLKRSLFQIVLFRFALLLREVDKPLILTQGGPGMATETISYWIYRCYFWFSQIGRAAAMAVILLVIANIVCETFWTLRGRWQNA